MTPFAAKANQTTERPALDQRAPALLKVGEVKMPQDAHSGYLSPHQVLQTTGEVRHCEFVRSKGIRG